MVNLSPPEEALRYHSGECGQQYEHLRRFSTLLFCATYRVYSTHYADAYRMRARSNCRRQPARPGRVLGLDSDLDCRYHNWLSPTDRSPLFQDEQAVPIRARFIRSPCGTERAAMVGQPPPAPSQPIRP